MQIGIIFSNPNPVNKMQVGVCTILSFQARDTRSLAPDQFHVRECPSRCACFCYRGQS